MLCGSLDGRAIWGRMDPCICMAESLRCSPKTITTLLKGCIPVQSEVKKKKNNLKTNKIKLLMPLHCSQDKSLDL